VKHVGLEGKIWRPKAMMLSLKALVVAGVEGVVVEIWWSGVWLAVHQHGPDGKNQLP